MAKKKKCICGQVYEVDENRVMDVGTDFGPEFKYKCPYCGSASGKMCKESEAD